MDDITKHDHPIEDNPRVAHEPGDADVFVITKYGIGLAICVAVVATAMAFLFNWFYHREAESSSTSPSRSQALREKPSIPPEPRLQATPRIELKELREDEAKILNGYGWVDPDKGIVRIPIAQAIDEVAKKGLPVKVTGK